VQVEAGPAVVGRISYDIPQGVSARVEGKGFDRTLSGRGTVENMPAGSYTAIASGSGYVEERTTIQIARGQETLYIAYRAGTLEITGTPAGADVYVDGMHRGALPLTLRDIVKGSHSIEVKEDGYEDAREAAAVQGGFGAKVSVALKKKPQVTQPEGFVMVDGGTFRMGDTFGAGNADEKPVHTVTVSSFFLSTYEVTFDQYDRFCDETGRSKPGDNRWGRGSRPAINVRWFDAAEYCNWLSRKEGLTSFYTISGTSAGMNWSANGYRLPTEAEWEYAAKGGKQSKGTRYSGGDSPDAVAWNWGNSGRKTQPVGGKQANELGLYDMSGNVWEWCNDLYGERYYASSPSTDPRGSDSGQYRVLRGGSWADNSDYLRASARIRIRPDLTLNHLGFRPARPFVQGR
jgi:formylglycine-generating enzyme required for sulfatase activity